MIYGIEYFKQNDAGIIYEDWQEMTPKERKDFCIKSEVGSIPDNIANIDDLYEVANINYGVYCSIKEAIAETYN